MTRLLIADGNNRDGRRRHVEARGRTSAESYASVLRQLDADVRCALISPADADGGLPTGIGWCDLDGVVFTGSTLKVGSATPDVTRQIDMMRKALAAGLPVFGSCWGMHVATVACGGDVGQSVDGSEYAFARGIRKTPSGGSHPLLAGRAETWDAPAIHADVVTRIPPSTTVLAKNDVASVQAMEIRAGAGTFWGTQYHPELDLDELGILLSQSADDIVSSGLATDREAVEAYADRIARLHASPEDDDLAGDLEVGPDVTEPTARRRELANFLSWVRGVTASSTGRTTGSRHALAD